MAKDLSCEAPNCSLPASLFGFFEKKKRKFCSVHSVTPNSQVKLYEIAAFPLIETPKDRNFYEGRKELELKGLKNLNLLRIPSKIDFEDPKSIERYTEIKQDLAETHRSLSRLMRDIDYQLPLETLCSVRQSPQASSLSWYRLAVDYLWQKQSLWTFTIWAGA